MSLTISNLTSISKIGVMNKLVTVTKDGNQIRISYQRLPKHIPNILVVLYPQELNSFITKSNKIRGEYIIGVTWCKRKKLFTSSIKVSGINKNLGYYDNEWSAFIAYKQAKENRAKELAEKWRGQIDDRVYEKLINYKVLLTD